jgi:hypothetical protein
MDDDEEEDEEEDEAMEESDDRRSEAAEVGSAAEAGRAQLMHPTWLASSRALHLRERAATRAHAHRSAGTDAVSLAHPPFLPRSLALPLPLSLPPSLPPSLPLSLCAQEGPAAGEDEDHGLVPRSLNQ